MDVATVVGVDPGVVGITVTVGPLADVGLGDSPGTGVRVGDGDTDGVRVAVLLAAVVGVGVSDAACLSESPPPPKATQ